MKTEPVYIQSGKEGMGNEISPPGTLDMGSRKEWERRKGRKKKLPAKYRFEQKALFREKGQKGTRQLESFSSLHLVQDRKKIPMGTAWGDNEL